MPQRPEVGFYGKLPSHGDFLRRRLPDAFVSRWDGWLQQCMAASRSALGDGWLDVYLTSPSWRFGCAGGACGPTPVVGVMAPSVDRVGRYFPLTVVAHLPANLSVMVAFEADAFFDCAERLIIETLEADEVDFDRFDDNVAALAEHFDTVLASPRLAFDDSAAAALRNPAPDPWCLPLDASARPARVLQEAAGHRLAALYDPLAVWWTEGSALVGTTCLVSRGLPHPDRFAALLDGSWVERSWQVSPLHVLMEPADEAPRIEAAVQCRYRSAAASDVGRVRTTNQDSFLERPEAGVWVVADGLGGHDDGDVASRMVCDALADWAPDSSFDATIDHARRRIDEVNAHLVRLGERSAHHAPVATTVVALLTRGAECAVIWAGDSRVYRWRAGRLERLTRDHSLLEAEGGVADVPANVVTRALGAEPNVVLDVFRSGVLPGDRFLLCSDGLTRTVPDERMQAVLGGPDIGQAVQDLIRAALEAGGPDNVTALVVEAET